MYAVGNVCSTCGCNEAKFPLVQCRREPYGDQKIYHRKCSHYRTRKEWAAEMVIVKANWAKEKFKRRRVKRIADRKVRWVKFKSKEIFSLCKCCHANSAEFPYVCCMVHPFGEIEFEDKCEDYMSHCDHELFLAYLFANYDEIKKTHIPGVRIKWPL